MERKTLGDQMYLLLSVHLWYARPFLHGRQCFSSPHHRPQQGEIPTWSLGNHWSIDLADWFPLWSGFWCIAAETSRWSIKKWDHHHHRPLETYQTPKLFWRMPPMVGRLHNRLWPGGNWRLLDLLFSTFHFTFDPIPLWGAHAWEKTKNETSI